MREKIHPNFHHESKMPNHIYDHIYLVFSNFAGELQAIKKVCLLRDDCIGFYDVRDDKSALRLCSADITLDARSFDRVWLKDAESTYIKRKEKKRNALLFFEYFPNIFTSMCARWLSPCRLGAGEERIGGWRDH